MAKDRSTVPANLKWRVEDIFASIDEWNALYAECETELDFSAFEGKLNTVETVLDGGCHACFGSYGTQAGDGVHAMTEEEQTTLTAQLFLQSIQ